MNKKGGEVSRCLHRLSGVYQDPSRVSRDATTLLQSETGKHLLVQSSTFLQNDGSETASLLLTGTIAMFYRGVTYNTPIDMYLPPHYPNRPPITFVRPAASMMIKEGHNHVGSDGMVYMPYLSSWQKQSHNLVDACLNMSSIFSNEPPCYAKPPGYNSNAAASSSSRPTAAANVNFNASTANSGAAAAAAAASSSTRPTPPRYQDIASSIFSKVPIPGRKSNATNTTSNNNNAPSEQEQLDQLAREAEAANEAVKIARAADAKEEQEQRLLTNDRKRLTSRCQDVLTSYKQASTEELTELVEDEILLHKSSTLLKDRIEYLQKRRGELETYHTQIDASIVEMQTYIQDAEEEKNARGELSADDMALPTDIQSGQMLILSAENAAIDDALFFLDKGLADHRNGYGLEVHMAAVRKLAKKQFLVRAHLLKIGQGKAYSSR
eukprot:496490_1